MNPPQPNPNLPKNDSDIFEEPEIPIDIPIKKYKLPDWITSKWDFLAIFKANWMFFLIVAIAFGVGWLVGAAYYQNQLAIAYNKAVAALPACSDCSTYWLVH